MDLSSFISWSSVGPSASQIAVPPSAESTCSDVSHDAAEIYVCDLHNQTFFDKAERDKHWSSFHQEDTVRFSCSICDKTYANKFGLDQHFNSIHLGNPYKCSVKGCDKFFKSIKGRNIHEQRHTGDFKYKCDICGKTFSSLSGLRIHKVSHSASKKYPCKFCQKRFTRTNDRKRHEEKSCPAKAEYYSNLSIGVCTDGQSDQKNKEKSVRKGIRCSICHKTFLSKEKVTSHITAVHRRERSYGCTECMQSFSSRSLLSAHRKDVHSD